MPSFDARLRLPGQSRLPLGVEVDIDHARMTVTAGHRKVGTWPLDRLEVETHPDGFHITVDGEALILNVSESARFATALSVARTPRPTLGSFRPPPPDSPDNGIKVPAPAPGNPVVAQATALVIAYNELEDRISRVAELLDSDVVSPAQAFGEWVRLLKELNRRHGQGSLPADHYFLLNTKLLDLIPEPKPWPSDNSS